MPKKERDEFSDFDDLFAEIEAECKAIDAPASIPVGNYVPFEYSKAARRPDLVPKWSKEIVWQRELIEAQIAASPPFPISVDQFLEFLEHRAILFVWQGLDGGYIRGFDKEGYSYDPITAVARAALGTNYSLCVSDLAGASLGLSQQEAKVIAFSCWNPGTQEGGMQELRLQMIDAIKRGIKI